MLEIASEDHQHQEDQRRDGTSTSAKRWFGASHFIRNQPEDSGHSQCQEKRDQHDRVNDVNNVPGIPLQTKRRERPDTIVIGEILEQMYQAAEHRVDVEELPVRRGPSIATASFHQPIPAPDHPENQYSQYRRAQQ